MGRLRMLAAITMGLVAASCATLGALAQIVQPPRFTESRDREAEVVFHRPSRSQPLGGAGVRIWARVSNPNPFGLTLRALDGDLFLEGTRAAGVNFPLGLPLVARGDEVIPIELSVGFEDLPRLAQVISRGFGGRVRYRVDGRVTVDAGPLGRPSFGPSTWLEGEARVR